MKWSLGISLVLVISSGTFACDEPKTQEKPKVAEPPKPAPAEVESEKREWFEGVFRGETELAAAPDALSRDHAAREGREVPESSEAGRKLTLEITVSEAGVTGRGTFGEEGITASGQFDDVELRVALVGPRSRGTWVAAGDSQAKQFTGELDVSTTSMEGTSTSTQPYTGKLSLNKVQ